MDIKKANEAIQVINNLEHELRIVVDKAKQNSLLLINQIPKAEIPLEEFNCIKEFLNNAMYSLGEAKSDAEEVESIVSNVIHGIDDAHDEIENCLDQLIRYNESLTKSTED